MTVHFQPRLDFEAVARASADGDALVLELEGWEGPLDVLLELARRQKVDLREISVAALAEQYLVFVQAARRRNFALAADYLVMAAWLAFLKSRLLLPAAPREADEGDAPPEALAQALAFRLAKLAAMREAALALQHRDQLGRDVFARGDPEARTVTGAVRLEGDLHALVSAYVGQRRRGAARVYAPDRRVEAYPLEAARLRLRGLLSTLADWAPLDRVAPVEGEGGASRASCLASTFAASLEMTRDGALELRQDAAYAPLHLRARAAA